MDADSILDYMHALELRGVSYNVARRLLDRASNQWTVFLTREDACELCEVTNWASARRSLKRLADAGLIAVHTNEMAYIRFLEPPTAQTDRAESARTRAVSAQPDPEDLTDRAETARTRAPSARQCAETARTRALSAHSQGLGSRDQGREGNDPIPPNPDLDGGAGGNRPEMPKLRGSAHSQRIPPAEQARSVRLLTDPEIGLSESQALAAAVLHPFDAIRAQAFRYLRDHAAGKARSPGCIPQRLAQPQRFPAAVSESDRASPLWQRHHTEAETYELEAAERRAKYLISED